MKKLNNKQEFYKIFSKVNKTKINESILDEIKNNIISVSDPLLKKLINTIAQAKSVEFETEFVDFAVSFKGFNIIDLTKYNNSEDIQDVYFTFDTVDVFDFTNEEECHLDDNAIKVLTKYIWNNKFWSGRVYEFVEEEMDKYNDPSNYIDEEVDINSGEDKIEGGVGDNINLNDYDSEQIKKGVKVEMEHTNDPKISLDIVKDHLSENPFYYGKGDENPELNAIENAQSDVEDDDGDSLTNMLLGFKPNNVGDYVNNK